MAGMDSNCSQLGSLPTNDVDVSGDSSLKMLPMKNDEAADYVQSSAKAASSDDTRAATKIITIIMCGATGNEAKPKTFHVDTSRISSVPDDQQAAELHHLGLTVYDQQKFEQGVIAQAEEAYSLQEKQRVQQMQMRQLKLVQEDIRSTKGGLEHAQKVLRTLEPNSRQLQAVKRQEQNKLNQLKKLLATERTLNMKMNGGAVAGPSVDASFGNVIQGLSGHCNEETHDQRMVRLGEMTPFQPAAAAATTTTAVTTTTTTAVTTTTTTLSPDERSKEKPSTSVMSDFEKYLLEQGAKSKHCKNFVKFNGKLHNKSTKGNVEKMKNKQLKSSVKGNLAKMKMARLKSGNEEVKQVNSENSLIEVDDDDVPHKKCDDEDDDDEDANYIPDDEDFLDSSDECPGSSKKLVMKTSKKKGRDLSRDDGNVKLYQERLKQWRFERAQKRLACIESGQANSDDENDVELDGGLRIPATIWNKLYRYQQTGVKWLWELHGQHAGGIMGDEMGLGKTIQMIGLLAGLHQSTHLTDRATRARHRGLGASLVICPATVMHQWVREFHKWLPAVRVCVLHSSGSSTASPRHTVASVVNSRGILITSYSGVVTQQDVLLPESWHYVILDEGHKIRNPNAQMTLVCKQFHTPHRIILSGSPMQNNLRELWSLFDFVFPGKLGTLPDFMQHFSVPIVQGGYANANDIQVQTAYKCACVLRDTINPYLLRRLKADLGSSLQLPNKNEQVLFCRLTNEQVDTYKEYLASKECQMILDAKFMVFPGLITLRKICNHPDLSTGGPRIIKPVVHHAATAADVQPVEVDEEMTFGFWKRSGKMIVVESLLRLWKKQGHKVLLFTQSRQMLDILEAFVKRQQYTYLRMDGTTSIQARQPLINKFNLSADLFVFLLTTRVGGLGINLTGADRIVIFDPDWNPSTDTQARERAWRIGQDRPVTIYRLLCAGTVEEKIYHRQIFKQFLTNRVLKDPKQRRFFKSNSLHELFQLGESSDGKTSGTETSAIFAGTGSDVTVQPRRHTERSSKRNCERSSMTDCDTRKGVYGSKPIETESHQMLVNRADNSFTGDEDLTNMIGDDQTNMVGYDQTNMVGDDQINMNGDDQTIMNGDDQTNIIDDDQTNMIGDDQTNMIGDDQTNVIGDTQTDFTSVKAGGAKKFAMRALAKRLSEQISSTSKCTVLKEHKKKRKNKKNREKRKDAMIDGESIKHLSHLQTHHPQGQDEDKVSAEQDNYVLRKLFKKTGMHSAMQHDRIMTSAQADCALVEREASVVAKSAAIALKQSRARCRAQTGVPTWTGQHGVAGAPRPRFGQKRNTKLLSNVTAKPADSSRKDNKVCTPDVSHFDGQHVGTLVTQGQAAPEVLSSNGLLARMRQRNNVSADVTDTDMSLLSDIRAFIQTADNGCRTTQQLLQQFAASLPREDTAKFRAMLHHICDKQLDGTITKWKLKPAFT